MKSVILGKHFNSKEPMEIFIDGLHCILMYLPSACQGEGLDSPEIELPRPLSPTPNPLSLCPASPSTTPSPRPSSNGWMRKTAEDPLDTDITQRVDDLKGSRSYRNSISVQQRPSTMSIPWMVSIPTDQRLPFISPPKTLVRFKNVLGWWVNYWVFLCMFFNTYFLIVMLLVFT
jgi:hypothetical protein